MCGVGCLIICVFLFSKCEDPIEVKVFDSEPLLVVEAQINWIKETQKTEQEVILSLSTSYFLDTLCQNFFLSVIHKPGLTHERPVLM